MVSALQTADLVGGASEQASLNPATVGWRGEAARDRLPGTIFLPAGTGGNMAVRRSVFEDLHGLDARYNGVAGEDLDFWWRAQYAGYSTGFAPDALRACPLPGLAPIPRVGKLSDTEPLFHCSTAFIDNTGCLGAPSGSRAVNSGGSSSGFRDYSPVANNVGAGYGEPAIC